MTQLYGASMALMVHGETKCLRATFLFYQSTNNKELNMVVHLFDPALQLTATVSPHYAFYIVGHVSDTRSS